MNCPNPNCNTTGLPEDAKFCPNCGCNIIDVLYQNERQKQREEEAKIERLRIQKEKEDYLRKREEERKEKEKEEKKASLLLKHKNTIANLEKIDEGAQEFCNRHNTIWLNYLAIFLSVGCMVTGLWVLERCPVFIYLGIQIGLIIFMIVILFRVDRMNFRKKKMVKKMVSYYESQIDNENLSTAKKKELKLASHTFCPVIVRRYPQCTLLFRSGDKIIYPQEIYYLRDAYINLLFEQL